MALWRGGGERCEVFESPEGRRRLGGCAGQVEEGGEEVGENLTKKKILTLKLHQVSKQPEEVDAQEQAGQDEGQGGRELCTSPRRDPLILPRPDQHSWVGKNVQVNPTLDLEKITKNSPIIPMHDHCHAFIKSALPKYILTPHSFPAPLSKQLL